MTDAGALSQNSIQIESDLFRRISLEDDPGRCRLVS
jgi:hypothetical protein